MWLTHQGKNCIELDSQVFNKLLTFYPEERLLERRVLSDAVKNDHISLGDLQTEADVNFIPWQMFLLNFENLGRQLERIESNRSDKIRITQYGRRAGQPGANPNRLIDRYIRAQTFLTTTTNFPSNTYVGSLEGRTLNESVNHIIDHFNINRNTFWGRPTKEDANDYLKAAVEERNINVATGTAAGRLVPTSENHKNLYKNVSGFCLKDESVPFIFVNANMSSEEEPVGRQIYTLVYMLTLIGLGDFTLASHWHLRGMSRNQGSGNNNLAHRITSEFLMPSAMLEKYRNEVITDEVVKELSGYHKITSSAVLFRLRLERYITQRELEALTPPPFVKPPSQVRSPHIETAVKKFNGKLVFEAVNSAFRAGTITANQAQYIFFGRIGRPSWRQFRARMNI